MPSTASATITAKWDWKELIPSSLSASNPEGTSVEFFTEASDVDGIELTVTRTNEETYVKLAYDANGYAMVNTGTVLRVPVVSTNDVVTIKNAANGGYCKIGGEIAYNEKAHQATSAEVTAGYVQIVADGGAFYVKSITVELSYMIPAPNNVIWDWQSGNPSSITTTSINSPTSDGTVNSTVDGIVLSVDASVTDGKLAYNSNGYAQFNKGTIIKVPVSSTNDVVVVVSYPGQSHYTVGGEDATGKNTFAHKATSAEVLAKCVNVEATATAYLYSIIVEKENYTTVTIGSTGWATFSSTLATDFTNLAGVVDAYQVTGFSGTAITKADVTTAAASTGLLLNGDAGTYAIPLTTMGNDLSSTNQLVAQTSAGTVTASGDASHKNYVLVASGGNVAFKSITGDNSASIGAGKAYLHLDISGGEPGANFLYFNDETTGVNKVKDQVKEARGDFFGLQGRKVAQPTKGLYIVNGKKVIIK